MTNKKITYEEITKETGISKITLVRMASRKKHKVNVEAIEKLCKYFGVSCDQLVTFVDDEKEDEKEDGKTPELEKHHHRITSKGNRK